MESNNTELFYRLPVHEALDQSEVEELQVKANAGDQMTQKRARVDNMLNPEPDDTPIADTDRPTKPIKSKTIAKKRYVKLIIGLVSQGMPIFVRSGSHQI
jgi:hypothetical protein